MTVTVEGRGRLRACPGLDPGMTVNIKCRWHPRIRRDLAKASFSPSSLAANVYAPALQQIALIDDLGKIEGLVGRNEAGRLQRFEDIGQTRLRDGKVVGENLQP